MIDASRAGVRGKRGPLRAAPPSRRQAGSNAVIPAHIRATHGGLGPDDRAYIRRKLGTKLDKFANSIERVSMRVEDVNGPRGGVDQVCRIKVVLSGLPSVVFESRDASLRTAVDGALSGVERTVRRTLQRRRMKPLVNGTRATAVTRSGQRPRRLDIHRPRR